MKSNISECMSELNQHNMRSNSTRMALSQIEYQVSLLGQKRERLRRAIVEHETRGAEAVIQVPFQFFEELHREHSRILEVLGKKINETENLAKDVFSQNAASPASMQP